MPASNGVCFILTARNGTAVSRSGKGIRWLPGFGNIRAVASPRPSEDPCRGRGGALKVVTTRMRPGYLRKNGVPYGANAVLTEYFDRIEFDRESYLILTSMVDDPQYLSDTFITSEQFRQQREGSKWNPEPCKAK
jgi:hypothetical protein